MAISDLIKVFSSSKPLAATSPSQPTRPSVALGKKVLIIEDEESLRQLYQEILQQEGFDVIVAGNGQEGFDQIIHYRPSVVLLDLMMPIMDGKTMLRKLREIPEFKFLPVVVLTNAGDIDSIREVKLYSNANAFLIKSNVTPQEIIQAVKTFL